MKLGQPKSFQKWGQVHGPGIHAVLLGAHSFINVSHPDTARCHHPRSRPGRRQLRWRGGHLIESEWLFMCEREGWGR